MWKKYGQKKSFIKHHASAIYESTQCTGDTFCATECIGCRVLYKFGVGLY